MGEEMSVAQQEQAIILGELRGQVKELIHSVNNLSTKVDGMGEKVMAVTFLANEVGDLKAKIATIEIRLATQEAMNHQSKGAKDTISAILKSPMLLWIIVLAAAAYTYIKGTL